MKIQIFSIHPLIDNHINKHIGTLIKNKYEIEYVNASNLDNNNFIYESLITLTSYKENFNNKSIINMISIYLFMIKRLFKSDAQIVHIHDTFLLPILLIAKVIGKKTIYDKHELIEKTNSIYGFLFTWFERFFGRYFDGIVYVTREQEAFIRRSSFKNSTLIPNYQSSENYETRDFSPSVKNTTTLIYIGSLSENDRQILLMLEIFEKCMQSNKNIKCVLGGKVVQKEIENKIHFLSKEFGNQFNFLGYTPYEKVIQETKNADIGFLLFKDNPITYNSSSNKLYEYLLCGLVFIGAGKFILDKEIKTSSSGKVFNFYTSSDEISNYILELASDKEKLLQVRLNSYKLGQNYTWESVENEYIILYNKLV